MAAVGGIDLGYAHVVSDVSSETVRCSLWGDGESVGKRRTLESFPAQT